MSKTHHENPNSGHSRYQQRLKQRGRRLLWVTLVAICAGLVYLAYWWQFASRFVVTNDAYVIGNLVPLKAQTIGTVIDVRADNTQYVKQGDVLVQLDGLQAKINLEQAAANLAETVRQVETLFSETETLRQKVAAQEATLHRHQHDLTRYRSVAGEGAVSAQQIEDAEFQVRELEAQVRHRPAPN
jgi:membrane fusion protein (multidrug efflux system)